MKKKNLITGGIVVLAVLVGGYVFFGTQSTDDTDVLSQSTVMRGDIANTVLVFGKAAPRDIYELSFDVSGKLTTYAFEEGDVIEQGDVIAQLDSSTVRSSINRANSAVAIEQSRLRDLRAGVSPEEEATQIAKIKKQQLVVNGAQSDFDTQINIALDDYYDLLQQEIDPLYLYPTNAENVILRFKNAGEIDDTIRKQLSQDRLLLERNYRDMRDIEEVVYRYDFFHGLIEKTQQLSNDLSRELDDETGISPRLQQEELEDFNDDLEDLFDALNTYYVAWTTAQQEYAVQERQLASLRVGADTSSLGLQQSVIRSKQSDLSALYTDLSKFTLKSPIAGVVFDAPLTNFKTVTPGQIVLSVVEDEPLVLFADVAESDVAYVGVGNKAVITFDALGGVEYTATVSEIKNRENLGEQVPTYKTTFVFGEGQNVSVVRSGMTANIVVKSGGRNNVLYIPSSYLMTQDEVTGAMTETVEGHVLFVPVQTGTKTTSGNVEILSGLDEGQTIVITK